jgi:hypothetical protein
MSSSAPAIVSTPCFAGAHPPYGGSGAGGYGGGSGAGGYGGGFGAGGYGSYGAGGQGAGWGPAPPAAGYRPAWGAPSGAGLPKDDRLVTLGIVCLVFGILKLLWVLYQIGSSAFAVFAFEAMISIVNATKVVLPVAATKAMALAEDLVFVNAFTTMGRVLPFGVLAGVQIHLGLRLHGADRAALLAVRKLVWWSVGAIVVSLLVQAIFVIPAQVEFARRLFDDVLRAVPWPGGVSPLATWTPPSPVWAITQPVVVAVAQTTWPIGLWIWSGRLLATPRGA